MKRSCALTQMTHVHRTTVIRLEKASQPVHDASSASFVHACYNALNRAITIFLLVRQQLERIDQVVTQPQRRCVRFEDLRFIGIDTESSLFTFADPISAQVLIIILLLPKAEHLKHRLLTFSLRRHFSTLSFRFSLILFVATFPHFLTLAAVYLNL